MSRRSADSPDPTGFRAAADQAAEELQVLFGANVRAARIKAGLSQTDLKARCNMPQGFLSELENGRRSPTLTTMVTVAMALETDVPTLLKKPRVRRRRSTLST